jgi:hypothetical protein
MLHESVAVWVIDHFQIRFEVCASELQSRGKGAEANTHTHTHTHTHLCSMDASHCATSACTCRVFQGMVLVEDHQKELARYSETAEERKCARD